MNKVEEKQGIEQNNFDEQLMEKYSRALEEQRMKFEHEKNMIILEMRADLDFQKQRACEFQEKYKNTIKYKNQEQEMKKIMNQLNITLKNKESQILEHVKSEQERKLKISSLQSENQQMALQNQELKEQLVQIQQGAISAILEKDNVISNLKEKVNQLENINDTMNLQTMFTQLEDRYRDLEQKSEAEKNQLEGLIENRESQIKDFQNKMDIYRERYEERIATLEQDILEYQKHIDKINEEKHYQESLEHRFIILEEKYLKTQKKLHDQENKFKTQREQYYQGLKKLQNQVSSLKQQNQDTKNYQVKIKEVEKELKSLKKEKQQLKINSDKTKSQLLKKVASLQQEKKKNIETIQLKTQQLQHLKIEYERKNKVGLLQTYDESTKQGNPSIKSLNTEINTKKQATQDLSQKEKLKKVIKSYEETIESLNHALERQTKEVQKLRQTLVNASGSASRSEQDKQLLIQIEDLNSHVKKFQHDLLLKKLSYAEAEAHWKAREIQIKKQAQTIEKKWKKERGQLLEKINQIKNQKKEKKTTFYQSSLK